MEAGLRFELGRPLGRGGYGTVFEAFDRERGERVAVKQLHQTSPRALASFKREFRTLSTLAHPGLPRLHDLFALGDDWCFSMELVEGEDLGRWRGRSASIETTCTDSTVDVRRAFAPPRAPIDEATIARVRDVVHELLAVLQVVHTAGFVHCDVKPSNVRVRPDGRAMLLDFGLARAMCEADATFAGTLAYAAPEQLHGVISPECDLYALGALAFELLTGSPPFGTGREAAENKQRRDAPSLAPRLPPNGQDLAELVAALLSRDPARRRAAVALPARRVVPARTAFVGRVDVLATIDRALDELDEGVHGVIVIEGASGIGKTTLLAEIRDRIAAARPSCVVLSGRAAEREHVPFNVLDGVADGLAALAVPRTGHLEALGRTFPVLRSGAPAMEATSADALADAFRATLRTLGRTVLLLDDVQWADADCERLLAAALAPPAPPSVLVILARRPNGGLDHTRLLHDARRIELGPLSAGETRALLVLRGRAGDEVDAIVREAKGHPLFALELLHSEDGRLRTSVDEAISTRLAALERAERRVLSVVALATEPIAAGTIAAITELPLGAVTTILDRLVLDRFARRADQGGRPRFYVFHDRIGEIVRADTTRLEAEALHLAFARALEGSESMEAMCHHLEAAGRREEAASYARRAADRAQVALAFDTEAWFRARELALAERDPETTRALRLRRADALRCAGRSVEAADELATIAATVDSDEAQGLRADAARLYLAAGAMDRGRELLGQLFEGKAGHLPATELGAKLALVRERLALRVELSLDALRPRGAVDRARLSALRAMAEGLGMTDNLRGAIFHARAVRLGLRSSDATLRGELLVIEAIFAGASGRKGRRRAGELLARAVAPFGDAVPPRLAALVASAHAVNERCQRPSHANLRRFEACEAFFESNAGDTWILWSLRISRARGARILGDLNAMRALYYPLLAKAEAQADVYARVTLRRGHIGLHLAADRPEAAREVLATTRWPGQRGAYHIQDWLDLEGRIETDLYERRPLELSPLEWRRLRHSPLHHSDLHRVLHGAMLGRALLAQEEGWRSGIRERRLAAEVRRVAHALVREREGYALTWARALLAGLAMRRGDRAGALRELRAVRRLATRYELLSLGASTALVLARLTTGAERSEAEAAAATFHHEQGVRRPNAWAGIAYPSFRSLLPL